MRILHLVRMWIARMWASVSRRGRDRELAEELETHLQLVIDAKVRSGLSFPEARRLALIESGGIEYAKEAYRDQLRLPAVESLRRTLRHARRGLRSSPGFSVAVVLSLALGVGANTSLFALIEGVLLRPLPYADPERLITVGVRDAEGVAWRVFEHDRQAWAGRSLTLESLASFSEYEAVVAGDASPEFAVGATVAPELADVLGIRPALGRWFTASEKQEAPFGTVVLSHALWQRQFGGDSGVVGRSLRIRGKPAVVIGVMPEGTGLPLHAQFWITGPSDFFEVVARVRRGTPGASVERELTQLSPSVANRRRGGSETAMVTRSLHDRLRGTASDALQPLFGAVILLLILACVNVTNLSLARTMERRRELAMHTALGATRKSLAAVVFAEHVLLAAGAGVAGVVLAWWTTRLLIRLSPADVARVEGLGVNGAALVFAAAVALTAACCVSLAPALGATRGNLQGVLTQGGVHVGRGRIAQRIRRVLVVAQLALALLLMVGAGLLIRSMQRLTSVELGFQPGGVAIATVDLMANARYADEERRREFFGLLRRRAGALPGVQQVTLGPPPLVAGLGDGVREGFDILFTGEGVDGARAALWGKFVGPGYFETYRIPLRAGRGISDTDRDDTPAVAVINESAARLFFQADPIGRTLPGMPDQVSRGREITVIGVVQDVRQRDVTAPANPEIFVPIAQQEHTHPRSGTVALRTEGDPQALIPLFRRLLQEADPELATTRLQTMQSVVDASLARQRFLMQLLSALAALAMILACLGLYAVVAYLVSLRKQEIGVRLALGAPRRRVVLMVVRETMFLVAGGIAIALPVALALSRLLAAFLYEVQPHDLAAFAAAPAVLALASMLAALVPARRAAHVDPISTLRME